MALPIIPDVAHVQIVMQYASGLPTDVSVNNLYFKTEVGETVESSKGAISGILDAAFGNTNAPGVAPLADSISSAVTGVTYRFYDLGQPLKRYPVGDPVPAGWVGGSADTRLPREVACCLSFKNGPGPRSRGRIYVGPLTSSSIQNGAFPQPSGVLTRALMGFGKFLIDGDKSGIPGPAAVGWGVVSGADAEWKRVYEVWVDNAFDTQRSRGKEPTARATVEYERDVLPPNFVQETLPSWV